MYYNKKHVISTMVFIEMCNKKHVISVMVFIENIPLGSVCFLLLVFLEKYKLDYYLLIGTTFV